MSYKSKKNKSKILWMNVNIKNQKNKKIDKNILLIINNNNNKNIVLMK